MQSPAPLLHSSLVEKLTSVNAGGPPVRGPRHRDIISHTQTPTAPGADGSASDTLPHRRLVEQHPVHAQLADRLGELLEIHRLDDVAVDAPLVTLHDFPLLVR